jgi:hypothetical protein
MTNTTWNLEMPREQGSVLLSTPGEAGEGGEKVVVRVVVLISTRLLVRYDGFGACKYQVSSLVDAVVTIGNDDDDYIELCLDVACRFFRGGGDDSGCEWRCRCRKRRWRR